jgi:hypothetical protein
MKGFIYSVELVVGSNMVALIEFLRFSTFNVVIFFEKFNKSENNIICVELEKVLHMSYIISIVDF